MQKKQYKPKPALGYLGKYVDKKTGEERTKINVILYLEELGLGSGTLTLVGLKNDFKKEEKHADYNFQIKTAVNKKSAEVAPKISNGPGFEL